ncbi:hypothetical protein EMIT0P201_50548 [Pseudomonas chlororaphis]
MNTDPAGTVDGLNLYRMVGNSPINHCDNSGLYGIDIDDIAGASKLAFKGYKAYKKASNAYHSVQKKLSPIIKAFKTIRKLNPMRAIKKAVSHPINKTIEKSREKILHSSHDPLDSDYYVGHLHKIKNLEAVKNGAAKGTMVLPHAPIVGAVAGAAVGYGLSKAGPNISRAAGKGTNKALNAALPNNPAISGALSVAASSQITIKVNGGSSSIMATAYSESVVAARNLLASDSPSLTQERTDIISHASVGAERLKSSTPNNAIAGAAIVAFGLEKKPTARETEDIGYAAAIGAEWTENGINNFAESYLPDMAKAYVKTNFTPWLSTLGGAAYASHVATERLGRTVIEFD